VQPVHFFWGSFDLAVTRFSGRRAPQRPDADAITREAYSHEVSSVGWWPGDSRLDRASFYSYAAPEPADSAPPRSRPRRRTTTSPQRLLSHYDDVRARRIPNRRCWTSVIRAYAAAAFGRVGSGGVER
jgi:hypothetical protein